MEIIVREEGTTKVLTLKGHRLDFSTSATLKEEIVKIATTGGFDVILNLQEIDFINSSGLGNLVSCLKELRIAKCNFVLCNLQSYVLEIFEICQLTRIFHIAEDETEAKGILESLSFR